MRKLLLRSWVSLPPQGWRRFAWYGPGLLWMLSAVGSGSILFTPRVASVYRYDLLWLLLLVVFFMWIMIREMARFSIVTGRSMLDGMNGLPGPRGWAVWLIFLPQLLAAAVGIAGLSAVMGGALASVLPGPSSLHGVLLLLALTAFTASGRYGLLESVSRKMAVALLLMVVVSAALVFPDGVEPARGLLPQWPADPDYYVILPWVGTILAGSMGIVWFGYWTATRGYGGGLTNGEEDEEGLDQREAGLKTRQSRRTRLRHARAWVRVMSGAAALGVLGGLLVLLAFMILGAELLAPQGRLPEGTDVALDLAGMFSEIWGPAGKWLLLAAVLVALGGSVLANQDGWGRSFADMTLILLRPQRQRPGPLLKGLLRLEERSGWPLLNRLTLKRCYIISVTGVLPLLILLLFRDPVQVMSASGIIAAAHTPFIVFAALFVNRTRLPRALRPGLFVTLATAAAGLFYCGFAVLYLRDLMAGW